MRRVPELRFDGFDGEWEIYRLGKISSKITKGTTPKEYGNGTVNFIKLENINSTGNICPMTTISSDIHEGALSRSILKENDILLSIAGALGRVGIVKNNILPANTNQALSIIRLFENYNAIFVLYYLSNGMLDKEINKIATIGAQPNISLSQVGDFKINLPDPLEQEKIGDLFKKIDDLIEIQEGKVSKMEDYKKSMLQKMFPKKDELVPEFRFGGFNENWESTRLSNISNRVTRRNLENKSKLPLTISSEFGLVNQLDYYNNRVASKDISNYYLIINGEFAYNKSTSLGAPYGAIKRLDNYENGALSTLYIVFEIVENNLDFMKYYFETSLWHKEIYKVSQEGARNHGLLNIATNDFFSMRIKLPSLEEQAKIGQFFKNLDTQIENEERLLDSYKMMKKSLLQKMFV